MLAYDPDDLVELAVFEHEFIAQLLATRLEANDIPSDVFALAGEQLGLLSASTAPHNGAQVKVRAADFDRAKPIYDEFIAESQKPDADPDHD